MGRTVFVLTFLLFSAVCKGATPPLTPNPSLVNSIQQLAPNTGMLLPDFTCTDVYGGAGLSIFSSFATGGPGVRDYCIKWVWAPSRRRALYAGANHGSPHKFNDVWEYDLASNTWVMLFKGDGAVPCHTWWSFTYDSKRDTLWWPSAGGCGSWVDWHVMDPEARGGWTAATFATAAPTICAAATFHYIPDLDKFIYYCGDWMGPGMWEYDPVTRRFTQIAGDSVYFDADCCPKYSSVMSYDTHLKILVAAKGPNLYHFNFATRQWKGVGTAPFDAADSRTPFVYDTASRLHLLLDDGVLYGYNAVTNSVQVLNPAGDPPLVGDLMGFYHEELQIFVVYKENVKTPWVYRSPAPATGLAQPASKGLRFAAFPNPSRGGVWIRLESGAEGILTLHDAGGRLVRGFPVVPGKEIHWNGLYRSGRKAPAGVYVARVNTEKEKRSFSIYLSR